MKLKYLFLILFLGNYNVNAEFFQNYNSGRHFKRGVIAVGLMAAAVIGFNSKNSEAVIGFDSAAFPSNPLYKATLKEEIRSFSPAIKPNVFAHCADESGRIVNLASAESVCAAVSAEISKMMGLGGNLFTSSALMCAKTFQHPLNNGEMIEGVPTWVDKNVFPLSAAFPGFEFRIVCDQENNCFAVYKLSSAFKEAIAQQFMQMQSNAISLKEDDFTPLALVTTEFPGGSLKIRVIVKGLEEGDHFSVNSNTKISQDGCSTITTVVISDEIDSDKTISYDEDTAIEDTDTIISYAEATAIEATETEATLTDDIEYETSIFVPYNPQTKKPQTKSINEHITHPSTSFIETNNITTVDQKVVFDTLEKIMIEVIINVQTGLNKRVTLPSGEIFKLNYLDSKEMIDNMKLLQELKRKNKSPLVGRINFDGDEFKFMILNELTLFSNDRESYVLSAAKNNMIKILSQKKNKLNKI